MMRTLYRAPEGRIAEIEPAAIPAVLSGPGGLLWLDLNAEPPESCEPLLCGTFGFHPLAVDDALQESHVPKLDDWGSYLYVVLHAVQGETRNSASLRTQELDLFVGERFLVTHHEEPIPALDGVWGSCRKDERLLSRGSEHRLYRLVDELGAGHLPPIEAIEAKVERLEEQILARPVQRILEQALRAKRALLLLRRILAPQREVLHRLARAELPAIRPEYRIYFRDVYDHLVRLFGITENVRDLVGGILEMYLSALNNRMNEVMKTLTLITTLFMPISFVVSFFGMNFFAPAAAAPPWTGRIVFWAVLGLLLLTPLVMYLWLRRRRWV